MKKIIFIFFVSFLLIKVNAQNSISGSISDETHQPLVGVSIYIPDMHKGCVSDQKGNYELTNLPNGKIKIQFSYIGYAGHIETIELKGEKIILNIVLKATAIEAEGIVVSGGYNSTQHENAVKIDLLKLNHAQIKNSPNFMEIITEIPGVDMISKGSGVSKPVIRGLSMNDILVLNNGVRIENYQYSANHPLGIDNNGIERIEIIKGPASVVYGSDAIGGVINFIKEKPAPIGNLIGDYNLQLFSNSLGVSQNIGVKGASKNFFGGFRFGHKSHADYRQGKGDYVPNSRFNEMTFNINTGYTGKIGTLKLYYDYFKQNLGMSVAAVEPLITERNRKNKIWYQDLEHQLLSSQNSLYLGKFNWEINAAYQKALRKLQTTLEVPFVEMNLKTITYESKLRLPSNKKSTYIIGFQGMWQTNKNLNNRASQFLPDAEINNIGCFAMAQYSFLQKITLQGGLRFDFYKTNTYALGIKGTSSYHAPTDKTFANLNGSLGATFKLNQKILFRTNVAKGYRVPNISELTSIGIHGNRYEIGNKNLSPENSWESDFSMHYHSTHLSFDIAGFYNHINHYIFITPTGDTTAQGLHIFQYRQADAYLFGGEAGLHYHPKPAKWLHLQTTFSAVIGKQKKGDYLPFIPAHKWKTEIRAEKEKLGFMHNAYVSLSNQTALAQNNIAADESPTKAYTLFDIGTGAEIKIKNQKLSFKLSINNLLDTKYIDHLSTLKEVNYFNPGRNITFSLRIPFCVWKEN